MGRQWPGLGGADARRCRGCAGSPPGLVDRLVGVVGAYPPGAGPRYEVRAFFPKDGATVEDPVTGSLNASLAQWLIVSGPCPARRT